MADPLDTIAEPVRTQSEVKASRFLADLRPVSGLDEADAIISEIKREFPDARHHCTALIVGPDGQRQRSNDDGEPAGTAGAPMLAVLRGAALTDVVAVVTRWFGGTLLGTGGLTRAYGGAVSDAVAQAPRLRRRTVERFEVAVGHEHAGKLEHRLRTWVNTIELAEVAEGTYDANGASFEVALLARDVAGLHALLAEAGVGAQVEELGPALRAFRI